MKKLTILMLFILMGGMFMNIQAQDKPVREVNPGSALSHVTMAQELANYGYQHKDALSLLTAAQILVNTPVSALKIESKKSEGGTADKPKTEPVMADILNPEKLVADAKIFGKDNPQILALAGKITFDKSRGAVDGPNTGYDRVMAQGVDVYRIAFYGKSPAEVAVVGDGDTDLDLYVFDENGNLIGKDEDNTDRCYVAWMPQWTGSFIIKVINRGTVYNNYGIATN